MGNHFWHQPRFLGSVIYCLILTLISAGEIKILSENKSGINLSYHLSEFEIEKIRIDGIEYSIISAKDLDYHSDLKNPLLPFKEFLVALLPKEDLKVSLKILQFDSHTLSNITIPLFYYCQDGTPKFKPVDFPMTDKVAEIVEISFLRDVRTARVRLYPFFYDYQNKILKIYNKISFSLIYEDENPKKLENLQPSYEKKGSDLFDRYYEKMFVNGERGKYYKIQKQKPKNLIWKDGFQWLKIEICSAGVYKIEFDDFKKAGVLPELISPKSLRMYHPGILSLEKDFPETMVEIPILVIGEEDNKFDKRDYIIFYGERYKSLYTLNNCYWLTWGGDRVGKRMKRYLATPPQDTSQSVAEEKIHIEYDKICPARSGLLWLWKHFDKPSYQLSQEWHIKISEIVNPLILKEITIQFFSRRGDNRVRIYLNELLLDSISFMGRTYPEKILFTKKGNWPLKKSDNYLKFELYGPYDMEFYLDYIEVSYLKELALTNSDLKFTVTDLGKINLSISLPKNRKEVTAEEIMLLDVSNHCAPKVVENLAVTKEKVAWQQWIFDTTTFYLVERAGVKKTKRISLAKPGRISNPIWQADYIIVTPKELYDAALLLKDYRQKMTKLKIGIAILSDIYQDYGFGLEEPLAIKNFLKDKRPYYGVFLGDASYDYRGLTGVKKIGVPTYEWGIDYDPTSHSDRAYCFDAWFADFDGEGSSPDFILSRLPVRSLSCMKTFLTKLKNYETRSFGIFNKRLLFLADDEFNGDVGRRDPIGREHLLQCERIGGLAGQSMEIKKVYLNEFSFSRVSDKAEAREKLIQLLNEGVLLWCFFGHGSGVQLTHENVLSIGTLTRLKNAPRYFFAFFGSCAVGRFDETEYECLAEELVRGENGAIACVAASKATGVHSNTLFAQNLFSPIFLLSESTYGGAFFQAWFRVKKYHLFGEPLTLIPLFPLKRDTLSVQSETMFPLKPFIVEDTIFEKEGDFITYALFPERYRTYHSWYGEIGYKLPGELLYLGRGRIKDKRIKFSFIVPKLPFPETTHFPNGRAVVLNHTCRVGVIIKASENKYSLGRFNIYYKKVFPAILDTIGPKIELYVDDKPLIDSAIVKKKFVLRGIISDTSGILIASDYPYALGFYLNGNYYDLTSQASYLPNALNAVGFKLPLSLPTDSAKLEFFASDNALNRSKKVFFLKVLEETFLAIKNFFFINQGANLGHFTFELNNDAEVNLRIYTLTGRLIKEFNYLAKSGFNQILWDKSDSENIPIPNGIYLCKISAKNRKDSASILDKIIVQN